MKQDRRLQTPSTKLQGHSTPILAADWFEDSSQLVSAAADDSTVRIWDVAAARTVSTLTVAARLNNLRLFPSGDLLVATFKDEVARVYSLGSGREVERAPRTGHPTALVVSAGDVVYWADIAAKAGVLWSWTPGSIPKLLVKEVDRYSYTYHLSFSDDGTKLWCFTARGLAVLDPWTGKGLSRFRLKEDDIVVGPSFALSTEPRVVGVKAKLDRDDYPMWHYLYRWDHQTGRVSWESERLETGYNGETLLEMARSTRWLAVRSLEGVTLVSSRSGRVLGVLPCEVPSKQVTCLSVSPNERFVAVGTREGDLVVHDLGGADLECDVEVPGIPKHSRSGSPLLLRLQKRPGLWLRVHANGDLEMSEGDARTDSVIRTLVAQGVMADVSPPLLASELSRRLWPYDLTQPLSSKRAHGVQVFVGADLIVEGAIGIEGPADILGFDINPGSYDEMFDGPRSARRILKGIEDLLSSLPGD